MDPKATKAGMGIALAMVVGFSGLAAAQAPVDLDVPTWFVGDSWNYSDNTRIEFGGGDFAQLNGTYTWRVTAVTMFDGLEVYRLEKTGSFTGNARISGLSANLRNGRYSFGGNASVMHVRRSDLGTVQERQFIRADVFSLFRLGWVELDAVLTQRPVIETYDFPLNDGNAFTADTNMRGVGRLEYDVIGLGRQRRDFDSSQLISIASGAVWDDARQTYVVQADVQDGSGSFIRDVYSSAVKNYIQEVAQIPQADAQVNYTRNLTGFSLVTPPVAIVMTVAGPAGDARAPVGEMVTVSGFIDPPPPAGTLVTIRQPETPGAEWTALTDGDGAFSVEIVVPDGFTDTTPTSVDVASVGLVASAGAAYTVATLVVVP